MEYIQFYLNEKLVEERHISPTTTLLEYLRQIQNMTGTKEGCAEGDCGACTVVIADDAAGVFRAVNSCLMLLPMLHGKRIWTVEGLKQGEEHHPAQTALVEHLGSQCGYCTPGIVMSMFEACYRQDMDAAWKYDDQMCGNLCRCTGYRPIRDALYQVAGTCHTDRFAAQLTAAPAPPGALAYGQEHARFYQPDTLASLWSILETHPEHRFVTGATDLGLDVTQRHARYACLVSLSRIPELHQLELEDDVLHVGAAVALSDLEAFCSQTLIPVARMLRYFGARQIKHLATLGGNLCNASPIGDMPPILIALGARVVAYSSQGERIIPIDDFFVGYRKTALQPGEILGHVDIPLPSATARVAAFKVSKRRELDISAVAAGFYVDTDGDGCIVEARIGYGGMAATPLRATTVESRILGQPFSLETFQRAAQGIQDDFTPLDDHRGSSWYRQTVAQNFVEGFYHETKQDPVRNLTDRHAGTVLAEEIS
jgi:xanthine dehydrogenase small subunit